MATKPPQPKDEARKLRDVRAELERHERVKRQRHSRDLADRALHHRTRRILGE